MNLQQLQYLRVLAQTQSYTEASKILHITQPSLSYAIKQLETELGTPLFTKTGRHIKLTPIGQTFTADIGSVLQQLNRSVERVTAASNQTGEIKIAATRYLNSSWTPQLISAFLKTIPPYQQPHIELHSASGFSRNIINALRTEDIDVAFCSRTDERHDITYVPIYAQRYVCLTPPDHPLAEQSSVTLEETLDYDQIMFSPESSIYDDINKLFAYCSIRPTVTYETDEDTTVLGMVAAGLGIAIIPAIEMIHNVNVQVIPLSFPKIQRIQYMATLNRHYQRPLLACFTQFVSQNYALNTKDD
ncbi:LysR family transcriptional regulator [Ligilactobacillus sp. LYQ139]|uniref:LysR family transcriptional regulator n=1 Tax=Ligilactobacillus sp. LYQ139 TaxID=3378800 RepID=UPI003853060E